MAKSEIWRFFVGEQGSATCLKCCDDTVFAGSTSTLKLHLQRAHAKDPEVSEYLARNPSKPEKRPIEQLPKITKYYKSSNAENSELDMLYVDMVVRKNLPLSFGEDSTVLKFIQALNKNYHPPNSKKFTKLLQEYVEDIKQLQMAILKDCEDVSMTTDIWTTKNCRNSYMATFVHFLTEDFQKKKILIGFSSLGNLGHDGNTIKNISEQCLSNFGLTSNQVITFVADGSSANIKAALLLGVQWIHCLAHVINLIVQNGLKGHEEFNDLKEKGKKIARAFHKNTILSSTLSESGSKHLIQSIVENYSALKSIFTSTDQKIKKIVSSEKFALFSSYELDLTERLIQLLNPFELATKKASSGDEFLSTYLCVALSLRTKMENFLNLPGTTPLFVKLTNGFLYQISNYFENGSRNCLENNYMCFAMLLDPRYAFNETILSTDSWIKIQYKFIAEGGLLTSTVNAR